MLKSSIQYTQMCCHSGLTCSQVWIVTNVRYYCVKLFLCCQLHFIMPEIDISGVLKQKNTPFFTRGTFVVSCFWFRSTCSESRCLKILPMIDVLISYSRKTQVWFITFMCASKPCQGDSMHNTSVLELWHLNGMQPISMLLLAYALFAADMSRCLPLKGGKWKEV